MNFLTRTGHSILYYKRNTLLLLLIFTILSTIILSGLCIRSASRESAKRVGMEIGGSVIIEGKDLPQDDSMAGNHVSLESAEKIAALGQIKESKFMSSTLACAKSFRSYPAKLEDTPESEHDLTLYGCNGTHTDVAEQYLLAEGTNIQPGDTHVAMVNQALAEKSLLKVGDSITVGTPEGREAALTIVGLYYTDAGGYYHVGTTDTYAENAIYTDLDTVAELYGNTNVRTLRFEITDPAEIPDLVREIDQMGLPEAERFSLTLLDGQYRQVASSMLSLANIATLIFGASILLGAVILVALVMISFSDREYEIGILLSMGENRAKVIVQLLLEVLAPMVLAVTLGVIASNWTASLAGGLLGAADQGIQVGLEPVSVLIMYLCGILLAVLASCVTAYKVLRYQPKKILMALE